MLRIEVSTSSSSRWQDKQFERVLRRKLLVLLNDVLISYPEVEINRIQFIKPRVK